MHRNSTSGGNKRGIVPAISNSKMKSNTVDTKSCMTFVYYNASKPKVERLAVMQGSLVSSVVMGNTRFLCPQIHSKLTGYRSKKALVQVWSLGLWG